MSLNTLHGNNPKEANRSVAMNASKISAITYRKPKNRELVISVVVSIGVHCLIVMFLIWGLHHLQTVPEQDGQKDRGAEALLISFVPGDELPQSTVQDIPAPVPPPSVTNTQPDPLIDETPQTTITNPEMLTSMSEALEIKITPAEKQHDERKKKSDGLNRKKAEETLQKDGTGANVATPTMDRGSAAGKEAALGSGSPQSRPILLARGLCVSMVPASSTFPPVPLAVSPALR